MSVKVLKQRAFCMKALQRLKRVQQRFSVYTAFLTKIRDLFMMQRCNICDFMFLIITIIIILIIYLENDVQGTKTRLHNARVLKHNFNNRELHTQHIFLTTQQDRNWSLIFG